MSKELDDQSLGLVSGGIPSTLPETRNEEAAKRQREREEAAADRQRRLDAIRENNKEIQKDFDRQLGK